MATIGEASSGDKAVIILQTLICYLREKNVLTRADLEYLCRSIDARAEASDGHMNCAVVAAEEASRDLRALTEFCGHRYGGKRARQS
jgi:hypothetical protein